MYGPLDKSQNRNNDCLLYWSSPFVPDLDYVQSWPSKYTQRRSSQTMVILWGTLHISRIIVFILLPTLRSNERYADRSWWTYVLYQPHSHIYFPKENVTCTYFAVNISHPKNEAILPLFRLKRGLMPQKCLVASGFSGGDLGISCRVISYGFNNHWSE